MRTILISLTAFLLGFSFVFLKDRKPPIEPIESWYIDENRDGQHDSNCQCGYCLEWTDSHTRTEYKIVTEGDSIQVYNPYGEDGYYLEFVGFDTTLKLGQCLTVQSIDTIEGLTAVTLK